MQPSTDNALTSVQAITLMYMQPGTIVYLYRIDFNGYKIYYFYKVEEAELLVFSKPRLVWIKCMSLNIGKAFVYKIASISLLLDHKVTL